VGAVIEASTAAALIHEKKRLLEKVGAIDEQLSALRAQQRHVTRGTEVMWEEIRSIDTEGAPLRMALAVSPHLGFDANSMRAAFIEIPPHSEEGAYHRHGEAVKFYLSGHGVEKIGDKVYEVEAGDIVFIPANVWHGTQNPTDVPLRIFAVSQALGATLDVPVIHAKR